jgi:DNA-binding transcriptional MerR regulator
MGKSPDAFRTISEVSEWLDTPAHVLRFWESKFAQIRPVKRAGGRRYYRPEDIDLLGGIKSLLHEQGMTIKGVQKLLREQGVRHVAGLGNRPLDGPEVADPKTSAHAAAVLANSEAQALATADQPSPSAAPEGLHDMYSEPASTKGATSGIAAKASRHLSIFDSVPAGRAAISGRNALPPGPHTDATTAPGILSAILGRNQVRIGRKNAQLADVAARVGALRDRLRADR